MITQVLTPFDSTKQAIEGTANFRANASYSWSWLIEHSNQQNLLIEQFNNEVAAINQKHTEITQIKQDVTTAAQNVSQNTQTTVTKASEASQSASSANASKNAAKTSEDNAKLSEQNALAYKNAIDPDTLLKVTDTIDLLTSTLTNKPLSANQGRILKGYIDSINTLLSSDDSNLDTLQEIVAYIKANKNNLDALADIHSKTAKTTLADADEFMTADSTSSWSLKKITWASIKTLLANLFISKVASTDNAVVRFNGTTGDVQNSGVVIDDNGKMTIAYSDSSYLEGLRIHNTANSASSQAKLYAMNNNNDYVSLIRNSTALGGHSMIYSSGNFPLVFDINGAERLRVDASGNVVIGATSNSSRLYVEQLNAANNALTIFHNSNLQTQKIVSIVNGVNGGTEVLKIDGAGSLLLTSGTGGLGYGTGAGGLVTQLTSKGTSVTLNKPSGQITMNGAALAAGASVLFILNNNLITTADQIVYSGYYAIYNPANYRFETSDVRNGNVAIRVTNISGASLSEAIVLNFSIIKGANA